MDSRYTIQAGTNVKRGKQFIITNYPLDAKLSSSIIPAIGTGAGIALGFKIIDFVAKKAKEKEGEMGDVRIYLPKGQKVYGYHVDWASTVKEARKQMIKPDVEGSNYRVVPWGTYHIVDKEGGLVLLALDIDGHPSKKHRDLVLDSAITQYIVGSKEADMGEGSRYRLMKSLRDYRENKDELEQYFDYGGDTDRIQSHYSTTWLEAGILGFAMRLDWTPSDLEKELNWVCGVGSAPRYKGTSLHPIVSEEATVGKEPRYLDYNEGKRIWEMAEKMHGGGAAIDESPSKELGRHWSPLDMPPLDQAVHYAGLYYAKGDDNLAFIYKQLAIDIQELWYGKVREQYPYARPIPRWIDLKKTTIEKHYVDWEKECHKGSVRAVKPTIGTIVYLGCLKKDKWDKKTSTCSPNPSVVKTIVLNTKENRDEVEHLKLVHPGIKINYLPHEVGVEPRMGEENDHEGQQELLEVIQAMKNPEEI